MNTAQQAINVYFDLFQLANARNFRGYEGEFNLGCWHEGELECQLETLRSKIDDIDKHLQYAENFRSSYVDFGEGMEKVDRLEECLKHLLWGPYRCQDDGDEPRLGNLDQIEKLLRLGEWERALVKANRTYFALKRCLAYHWVQTDELQNAPEEDCLEALDDFD